MLYYNTLYPRYFVCNIFIFNDYMFIFLINRFLFGESDNEFSVE